MTATAEAELAKPKKGKGPARRNSKRQAQNPPPQGDWGADTAPGSAQMRHAEIVPMHKGNWYFKRRLHPLDLLAKPYGRRRTAAISIRERNAGMAVVDLAEATERSGGPAWNKVYVDASPKPGNIDVKRLEVVERLRAIRAAVPRDALPIVNHVVFYRGMIWQDFTTDARRAEYWLGQLRLVLDKWADLLGY